MRYPPQDRVMAFGIRFPQVIERSEDHRGEALYALPGGGVATREQCRQIARGISMQVKQLDGVQR